LLLAVMVSLAEMWQHLGVRPAACVGHSQGDIAAAVVAGALSTGDAMRIVTARSVLYDTLAGSGTMALVGMDAPSLATLLPEHVTIAAENAPTETVVSGPSDRVEKLLLEVKAAGHVGKVIRDNDIAAHSPAVEALRARLFEQLPDVQLAPTGLPFVSSVVGGVLDRPWPGAGYWYENMRHTVRFREATEAAVHLGARHFIEVSPHPLLGPAVLTTAKAAGAEVSHHGTLFRRRGGIRQVLRSVAGYFVAGGSVDWSRVHTL
jgi:acyl transferase domain-containing protein